MKKLFLLMVGIFFVMGSIGIFAESSIKIKFINKTGHSIRELYISPTSHDDWYDNLIKGSSVPDGESIEIEIPEYNAQSFVYDLMAMDTEGDTYSKYEVDFTDPSKRSVEVTFDDYEGASEQSDKISGTEYNTGYRDGYRDAYRDAYSEAYKEGYKAGVSEVENGAQ